VLAGGGRHKEGEEMLNRRLFLSSFVLVLILVNPILPVVAADIVPPHIHFWSTPGHWVEWTIGDAVAGKYDLYVNCGTRYFTKREFKVNGQVVKGLEAFEFPDVRGWTNFKELKLPVQVPLKTGKNTLRITCLDETSMALEHIRLAGPKELEVDGVDFSAEGGGKVQRLASDEGGFFNQWDKEGHWLEWAVDCPAAGEYDVMMVYAAHKTPPKRELQINGTVVKGLEAFTLKPSGGWRYWVPGKLPAKVQLKTGKNVMKMTNLGNTACNVSSIRFSAPGKKTFTVYAVDFTGEGGFDPKGKRGGKVRKYKKGKAK
jgi:carbohydrate binding protein with CBM6 domain